MNIVILGQTIPTSFGNGYATSMRGLVKELKKRGHEVLFLERDKPLQTATDNLLSLDYCKTEHYASVDDLQQRFTEQVREAELVIVGSEVTEGVAVGEWVVQTAFGIKAFYDFNTTQTLAQLKRQNCNYLNISLIPKYDLYLSVTGGPTLQLLEKKYGAPAARALYFSFDSDLYFPEYQELKWDLGYLNMNADDKQPALESLMVEAAKQWPQGRFAVAGMQLPKSITWPENIERIQKLEPKEHRSFYNSQRFTQQLTSSDMRKAGYSPTAHLFEAAACCTPIISEYWDGLDSIFDIGSEILVARSAKDTLCYLREICNSERKAIGARARKKVVTQHSAAHRALELEKYVQELMTVETEMKEQVA
ncbi:CgeB family protein [Pontibacter vulgaris]|uniref:CgeB family protein n=1 Tax=Pontibacter vulgaris TaxID=2905679 RepID=UPI001FA72805|nr:glycosyltransferase [Pontibacter vulgaris]